MALRKTQKVENAEVLSAEEQERINAAVSKLGKTSASQLTDSERKVTLDNQH